MCYIYVCVKCKHICAYIVVNIHERKQGLCVSIKIYFLPFSSLRSSSHIYAHIHRCTSCTKTLLWKRSLLQSPLHCSPPMPLAPTTLRCVCVCVCVCVVKKREIIISLALSRRLFLLTGQALLQRRLTKVRNREVCVVGRMK